MAATQIARLTLLIGIAASSALGQTPASQELSVSRILIPHFSNKSEDSNLKKFWEEKTAEFQSDVSASFNKKFFFEPVSSSNTYDFGAASDAAADAKKNQAEAVLVGEFHDADLHIEIVSASGRVLDKTTIPLTESGHLNPATFADTLVDVVAARIKYVGFVTDLHKNEAKINAGSKQGLVKGEVLIIFDFDGDQPTFESRVHRVAFLRLMKVADEVSIGTIIPVGPTTSVTKFSKVAIPRTPTKSTPAAVAKAPPPPAPKPQTTPKPAAPQKMAQAKPKPNPTPEAEILPEPEPAPVATPPPPKPTPPQRSQPRTPMSRSKWVNPSFWISLGGGLSAVTSQASGTSTTLQERSIQAPTSPTFRLALGYSKISLNAFYSSASNTSNSVGMIRADILYQILAIPVSKLYFLTNGGLYYAQYSVSTSSNPTSILISSSTYSPKVEELVIMPLSPKTALYGGLGVFFPLFSSDSANGGTQVASSFGFGGQLGLKYQFSNQWSADLHVRGHYFSMTVTGGQISETHYYFGPSIIYSF